MAFVQMKLVELTFDINIFTTVWINVDVAKVTARVHLWVTPLKLVPTRRLE